MSTGSLIFMALSWAGVIGLVTWSYSLILKGKRHFDPDGLGPAVPAEPGRAERR